MWNRRHRPNEEKRQYEYQILLLKHQKLKQPDATQQCDGNEK